MELGNLLELALSVLPAVNFYYRHYTGEQRNELGVKIPTYGEWLSCRGMVQPVQRSKYEDLGLDFAKNYINVWGTLTGKIAMFAMILSDSLESQNVFRGVAPITSENVADIIAGMK